MAEIQRGLTVPRGEMSDAEEDPPPTNDRWEVHQYQQNKDRADGKPSSKSSKDKQPKNKAGHGDTGNPEEKTPGDDEAKIRKIAEEMIQKELSSRLSRYMFWIIIAGIVLVCLVVLQFVWFWQINNNSGTLETLKTVSTGNEYSLFVKNEDYNKDKEKTKELLNDHEQAIMNKLSQFVTNADYSNDKAKATERFEQQVSDKVEATKKQIQGSQESYFSSLVYKLFGVGREKEVNLATLKDEVEHCKADIKKIEQSTCTFEIELKDNKNELKVGLKNVNDSVSSTKEKLNQELSHAMEKFADQLSQTKQKMVNDLEEMERMYEHRLNEAKAALANQYNNLDQQVSKSKEVVEEILLPNAFDKDAVLQAFLLLLVLGIGMFFYLRKSSGQHDVLHHRYQEGLGSGSGKSEKSVSPAVARIPLGQPLQSAICVISFDKHTQALHRKVMMEQVLHGLPEELIRTVCPQFRLVLQHEDITRLPATKLYIMFVDYSERHVIIEEPGLGLGDTRRTTVQALERFGGELVIIYMYDMASRHLSSNRRYNRDIYCVKTQPTLKTLNERGRFFSIYETLNDFQRQNLQSTIQDVFSE